MTRRAGGAVEDEAVKYTTHDGGSSASIWQGNVPQLMPGTGYEFQVAQSVTFRYRETCARRPTSPALHLRHHYPHDK